jgi:hypothetical protein
LKASFFTHILKVKHDCGSCANLNFIIDMFIVTYLSGPVPIESVRPVDAVVAGEDHKTVAVS